MSTNASSLCLVWQVIQSIILKQRGAGELVILRVESDELGSFLHQRSGHIGHTSGHGRLADSYRVSHGCLERA